MEVINMRHFVEGILFACVISAFGRIRYRQGKEDGEREQLKQYADKCDKMQKKLNKLSRKK